MVVEVRTQTDHCSTFKQLSIDSDSAPNTMRHEFILALLVLCMGEHCKHCPYSYTYSDRGDVTGQS